MNEPANRAKPGVDPAALAKARKFLEEHDVQFVLAQFVDIHGVAKSKAVPVAHLEDILTTGAGFAGGGVWGLGIKPHEAEYLMVGDIGTLTLMPWAPGYARVMGTGMCGGRVHPLDSRNVLKLQADKLARRGLTLNAGLEPEFFLFKRTPDGGFAPFDETDTLAKAAYDYRGMSRVRTWSA
jgi:glutamine synthetase